MPTKGGCGPSWGPRSCSPVPPWRPANTWSAGDSAVSLLECRCRLRYSSGFQLDVDFTTAAAVTALFGPSGSGKTSVLSVLAGLRRPDAGRVRLGARVLD